MSAANAAVSVVIPWRDVLDEQRTTSLRWVLNALAELRPEWEVVLAGDRRAPHEPWSASTARNRGVEASHGDVIVLLDADTWVQPAQLLRAVAMVERAAAQTGDYDLVDASHVWPWVQPHSNIVRLSPEQTADYQAHGHASYETSGGISIEDLAHFEQAPYHQFPGCVPTVITRELYEVCPQDPRFECWVPEDVCWGFALEMLHCGMYRLEGNAVHFYHEPDSMRAQRAVGLRLDQVKAPQAYWAAMELRFRYANIHGKWMAAKCNGRETEMRESEQNHEGIAAAVEEMRALVNEYAPCRGWGESDLEHAAHTKGVSQ